MADSLLADRGSDPVYHVLKWAWRNEAGMKLLVVCRNAEAGYLLRQGICERWSHVVRSSMRSSMRSAGDRFGCSLTLVNGVRIEFVSVAQPRKLRGVPRGAVYAYGCGGEVPIEKEIPMDERVSLTCPDCGDDDVTTAIVGADQKRLATCACGHRWHVAEETAKEPEAVNEGAQALPSEPNPADVETVIPPLNEPANPQVREETRSVDEGVAATEQPARAADEENVPAGL